MKYALLNKNAKPPVRKNKTDAGIDIYSVEDVLIPPNSSTIVHTGITIEVPENNMLLLLPKSRANYLIGAGVVDPYYQPGEILVKIVNFSQTPVTIKAGDAICQGILIPIIVEELEEVSKEAMITDHPRSGKGGIVQQLSAIEFMSNEEVNNAS